MNHDNSTNSGFESQKYNLHMEEMILTIFNRPPYKNQPKYIINIGCGDGTLLKKIYELLIHKSLRGKHLSEYPLVLVGIDNDDSLLQKASHILKNDNHIILKSNILKPQQLIKDLHDHDINDFDNVLHIRSFIDHAASPQKADLPAKAIQQHETDSLNNNVSTYFKHYSPIIGKHGLITIESHYVSPGTKDAPDTFLAHRFPDELYIKADSFLMAAAGAWLFPDQDRFKTYPEQQPFSIATLNHFYKRKYLVRPAREDDMPILEDLEKKCWGPGLRTPISTLKKRIQKYPAGQLVVEMDGNVTGVIYTQRISDPQDIKNITSKNVDQLHKADGSVVQLLSINILPEKQHMNLGDQLLEFALQKCRLTAGIKKVVGVTRCKEYAKHTDIPLPEYIHSRNTRGKLLDSILRFHELHGAKIIKLVDNYRPKDTDNKTCGVLVEYDIVNRKRDDIVITQKETHNTITRNNFDPQHYIEKIIQAVLGPSKSSGFDLKRPLMEMGLDSADLLDLNEQISEDLKLNLETAFFFQYNTPAKIISYLQNQQSVSEAENNEIVKPEQEQTPRPTHETNATPPSNHGKDIAIIGISCRLPGGSNRDDITDKEAFWELLKQNESVITEITDERLTWPAGIDPAQKHKGINKAGLLKDIASFDASFFRISPREAEYMDPQQRLLLEESMHCIEDAGYAPQTLTGTKTGVFIGASGSDYSYLPDQNQITEAHLVLGNATSMTANRISYFYDFCGPSLQIDTACSSSLVAIYKAIEALNSGECDQALVGGINIICHPRNSVAYYKAGMLSRDGSCKTFDKRANGYVRSEGTVIFMLKPLEQAVGDHDSIYAVIKGASCNHGGQSGGLTVPNPEKQTELLIDAWTKAGISPADLGYIEAHGTGTSLGDPIEVHGIQEAFARFKPDEQLPRAQCGLSSVKSNIGHLEAAAGIVGVLKAILCMKHHELIATINYRELNPQITIDNGPLYIITENQEWPTVHNHPRYAAVSSFGSGGTNAHVVLEEYTPANGQIKPAPPKDHPVYAVPLSAKNKERLTAYAKKLHAYINTLPDENTINISDLAYTLQTGRETMECRVIFMVRSIGNLREQLDDFITNKKVTDGTYLQGEIKKETLHTLKHDDDIRDLLAKWLSNNNVSRLAEFWIQGYTIEWNKLYHSTPHPYKINLPTYPFEKEHYWIPENKKSQPVQYDIPFNTGKATPEPRTLAILEKTWTPSGPASLTSQEVTKHTIAVLTTDNLKPLTTKLKKHLPGIEIITPATLPDAQQDNSSRFKNCKGCIDLTGLDEKQENIHDFTWIPLVQQIIEHSNETELILLQFSYLLECFENSKPTLNGAHKAGLYRMLQTEYKKVRSRHIDTDLSYKKNQAQLIDDIVNEWQTSHTENEVCYRKGERYKSVLTIVKDAQAIEAIAHESKTYDPAKILFITGGTGGLGLLCADYFVKNHHYKNVVLCGREQLPSKKEWEACLTSDRVSSRIKHKIKGIMDLEKKGAKVTVLTVPLTDIKELQKALKKIKAEGGAIGGVIHAAGILDMKNPAFMRKTAPMLNRVIEPKVKGLKVLGELFKQENLDFFLTFSSIAATVPGLGAGNADYALANAFMDYYAQNMKKTYPITSIQWPSWKDSGLGEITSDAYRNTGFLSHTDEEGLTLLDVILKISEPGSVFLPGVVAGERFDAECLLNAPQTSTQTGTTITTVAPHAPAPGDFLQEVEEWIKDVFSKELKLPKQKIDGETAFQDYGADSILLSEILQEFNTRLDLELSPSTMLEFSTIHSLMHHLYDEYPEALTKTFEIPPVSETMITTQSPPAGLHHSENRASLDVPSAASSADIAVVGMSARFAGAETLDAYWQLLAEGKSALSPIPENCWGIKTTYHAGLLDFIYAFDPTFFNIAEEDIRAMDPQALLLLEETLKTVYHAGYDHQALQGNSIGVYIGARSQFSPAQELLKEMRNPILGIGQNYLAANISQFFNFQGPSLVIDTACSSALVGMNMATQALKTGEINAAVVGGISLLTTPDMHRMFEQRNLLNPDGKFHIFDRRASGVVLGEGAGVVMLKTLDRAVQDGDTIYAVIKGLAINNDGRTAGPATPNINALKDVMQKALHQSGHNPEEITHIDVNGSGSEVTDLLEVKAIEAVYRRDNKIPCSLGSMKPNIGHPLCAEGIASFIKVVLMLHNQSMVPFLSGNEPLTHYDFTTSPFKFRRTREDWDGTLAALSSFADGGTNAHAILRAYHPGNTSPVHTPLPIPELHRIDVRTMEPTADDEKSATKETADHTFTKSPTWSLPVNAEHPIFKNHVAYGQELLPGLAYIDLLYQWFNEIGYDYTRLELKNLSIYRPFTIEKEGDIQPILHGEKDTNGIWKITVNGLKQGQTSTDQDSMPFITAEMHPAQPGRFDDAIDFEKSFSSCDSSINMEDIYKKCRSLELFHTGIMQATGMVYLSRDENLLDIAVNEEYRDTTGDYIFHPVLIDAAAIGSGAVFSINDPEEKRLYLPLFYESFKATEMLQTACVIRIKKSSFHQKDELITLDMEFFNKSGKKVAELKNFKNKLVREAGLINPKRETAVTKKAPAAPVASIPKESGETAAGEAKKMKSFIQSLIGKKISLAPNRVNANMGYYELGLTSAALLEIVREIETKLQVSLTPTLLFEYTTIATLADYLDKTYGTAPDDKAPEDQPAAGKTGNKSQKAKRPAKKRITYTTHAALASKTTTSRATVRDIAIIGMSGKYPRAKNIQEFWENLKAGKDCITTIPEERWPISHLAGITSPQGKAMSQWGGFIDNVDCFDPRFFRISPREAEYMDPQERLFLEVCWETMEDAGYTPLNLVTAKGQNQRRAVGVFVGVMHNDYSLIGTEAVLRGQNIPIALNYSPIANRVSFFCNFHGPSLAVDTVCSSSLTAVHLAIESLLQGESEVALAGGVNLSLHPNKYLTYGLMGMHASDGYCHTFGEGGDGYVSAEGVGAVLLKPLDKAIEDNDNIYAVIKGSTINHVGTVSGMTVPGPIAQAELIADCLEKTGINPETINYVEAHGTGTSLGDPIEFQGLNRAFRKFTQKTQFCALGSVKSNIGHAESAAGISGLTKAILQIHHKTLVPSLHSQTVNPYLDLKSSPFYLQHKLEEWRVPEGAKETDYIRRAGISSFGAYGSNAHIIIEEYRDYREDHGIPYADSQNPVLLPISAKNKDRLRDYVKSILSFIDPPPVQNPHDVIKERTYYHDQLKPLVNNDLKQILADIITIQATEIESELDFQEYSIDRIQLNRLCEQLHYDYAIDVEIKNIIEAQSLKDIGEYLCTTHQEALVTYYEKQGALSTYTETSPEPVPHTPIEINPVDLAYTFQVGRTPLEERLVVIAGSLEGLKQKLTAYLADEENGEDLYAGRAQKDHETIEVFNTDEELQEAVNKWFEKKKLSQLADLWVKGLDLNWDLLYPEEKPNRISLPTYPFAKERYWIENDAAPGAINGVSGINRIHPLLHENTSNFETQRFTSIFTGEEFFLRNHVLQNQKVLPAATYLEMIRAAVEKAVGITSSFIQLGNIIWTKPFISTDEAKELNIRLFPEDDNYISYEIYDTSPEGEVMYSRGQARLLNSSGVPEKIDIAALKAACNEKIIRREQNYEAFEQIGITYGSEMQSIPVLYAGKDQVVAEVELADALKHDTADYFIHPAILDGALQSAVILLINKYSSNPGLPFGLESIDIIDKTTDKMFAVAKLTEDNTTSRKLDIDVCDDAGRICIRLRGLTIVGSGAQPQMKQALIPAGDLPATSLPTIREWWDDISYVPVWKKQTELKQIEEKSPETVLIVYSESYYGFEQSLVDYHKNNNAKKIISITLGEATNNIKENHWTCDTNDPDGLNQCLKNIDSIDCFYFLAPPPADRDYLDLNNLLKTQQKNELQLLRLVKHLTDTHKITQSIDCYIVTINNHPLGNKAINPFGAGATGLAYSIAQGNHRFLVRNIDLDPADLTNVDNHNTVIAMITREAPAHRGDMVKFQGGDHYRRELLKFDWHTQKNESGIQQNGVYVILGGSGTVGTIITRHLMEHYDATVIWLGRRPESSPAIRDKIVSCTSSGKSPVYIQGDVTDLESMQNAVAAINKQYPKINGAIFSGLVMNYQNSIAQTTDQDFLDLLNVKTKGSLIFYKAFQNQALDFMCYFSSGGALSGAANFSAYATGIAFSDTFIQSLQATAPFPVGSINWGFWQASLEQNIKEFENVTHALDDHEGFAFLERFTSVLRKGIINRASCMKLSEQMQAILNCSKTETAGINDTKTLGVFSAVPGDYPEINRIKDLAVHNAEHQKHLDVWMTKVMYYQMQRLGLFSASMINTELTHLHKAAGVLDKYARFLRECLTILSAAGYCNLDNGRLTIAKDITIESESDLLQGWEAFKQSYIKETNYSAQVNLVDSCLQSLPEILTGKIPATDIIFPNSSMEKVEGIYKNNAAGDFFNMVLADVLPAFITKRIESDPQAKIRIAEIGAGTGGTSAIVLRKLASIKDCIEEYCYTDVSKAFLMFGEEHYGADNPFLTYTLLDIEKPLAGQKIDIGGYDIVIAANVLHATKNIRKTLRNAKALLHGSGILLLNEIRDRTIFNHLTFGLLDGWWLYEDENIRIPGCPGLYPEAWKNVLEEEGFSTVSLPTNDYTQLDLQIICAQSNGVIRQEIAPTQTPPLPATNNMVDESINYTDNTNTGDDALDADNTSGTDGSNADLKNYVTETITDSLAQTLKAPKNTIDKTLPFSDYGLDSILGVSFTNMVNERLGITLNTVVIFDYTSIARLATYVIKTFHDTITLPESSTPSRNEKVIEKQDTTHKTTTVQQIQPFKRFHRTKSVITPVITDTALKEQDEIAIIGISGLFPGADDVHTFWNNLREGKDGLQELPASYMDPISIKHYNKSYKWGGILEDRDCFDPLFFNISPREARSMNPHQRLILQESWKALEDAGYNPNHLADSQTGIFIGAEPTGYIHETFTGSSEAIVASRLSYFLNFFGPALVVNTGCSSSAVAIHLACESLRNSESNLALAGGVNASMDQAMLIPLLEAGILSPTGRCHTFDERANGTVISEAVGVLVLKRLKDAQADGDCIYGTISGSGMNQDGASNGITAPNGIAQEQLITSVYEKYTIDPAQISYVEAHGTGTKLGDPIEANALVRAFKQFTDKTDYCAIGSAKAHIGHAAGSAGVVGIIKILLSMKHHQLPGLLNFKTLNPMIDFNNSAFYINKELIDWTSPDDTPLTAALNSFGHSGTNAHIVIKEYKTAIQSADTPIEINDRSPTIIILSAKSNDRLAAYAQNILSFINSPPLRNEELDLAAMAYTLQTGRSAMHERLGIIVHSIEELQEKLTKYLAGSENISNLFEGNTGNSNDTLEILNVDKEFHKITDSWIKRGKYTELVKLWVKGLDFDWNLLYATNKPPKMNIPTYPFAKERYWMEVKNEWDNQYGRHSFLHPLLHENTSSIEGYRFSSIFTGEEFFLHDHVIKGRMVLPGTAYLEMARTAIENMTGTSGKAIQLENIIWAQPFSIDDHSREIHIALLPGDDGGIAYEIYGTDPSMEEEIIYSGGKGQTITSVENEKIDIDTLKNHYNQKIIPHEATYEAYEQMGITYGAGYRVIQELHIGGTHLLAKLSLSSTMLDTLDNYTLHPGLLDGALQATIGFILDTIIKKPSLPFALEKIEIFHKCREHMWAHLRYSKGSSGDSKVRKFDIDICDEQGLICIKITKFTARVLAGEIDVDKKHHNTETMLLEPVWQPMEITEPVKAPTYEKRLVILLELDKPANLDHSITCMELSSNKKELPDKYKEYTIRVFEAIQKIIQEKPKDNILIQVLVPDTPEQKLLSGISGLLKTAKQENPKIKAQIIEIPAKSDILHIVEQNTSRHDDDIIRYDHNNQRQIVHLQELDTSQKAAVTPWRDNGVYLITGGLGGLGRIIAKDIGEKTMGATLILTGRSKITKKAQDTIKELEKSGLMIRYQSLDVSHKQEVETTIQTILDDYGTLDGIIHSAGIINDNFIIKKQAQDFHEVLAPKVQGLINLDEATKNVNLNFIVLFSSIAGSLGNVGQADYAAANAFMDHYAAYRNKLVNQKQRSGKTIAINWPLWAEGGMHIDHIVEQALHDKWGMVPLTTENGIKALYHCINSEKSQVMVMEGEITELDTIFFKNETNNEPDDFSCPLSKERLKLDKELLRTKTLTYLKKQISEVLHLSVKRLKEEEQFEKYGIDSIMVMQLTTKLEKSFGTLSKTLFFEYQTLKEITTYFLENHHDTIINLLGLDEQKATQPEEQVDIPVLKRRVRSHNMPYQLTTANIKRKTRLQKMSAQSNALSTTGPLDIAIIGLSGKYPGADTIQAFWDNLRQGKDSITEVPKERWNWREYYTEDKTKPGAHYSKYGGFIKDVDKFDPLFFNISPREARLIDPQERLFIEQAYHALEDAGYTRNDLQKESVEYLPGQVGVYAGVMYSEYQLFGVEAGLRGQRTGIAGSLASIANRVSYFLNIHGPSMTLDTMCSSSLTAVHLACQDLKQGRINMGIAGGVNVTIHPNKYLMLSSGQVISSRGRCESFGRGGEGYIPGEGVGVIILKRLQDAVNDNDHIYGVIKGSTLNHGGKTNGYSIPNPNAQAEVINRTIDEADVKADVISYIEAHGTGTKLGDPIEITGLSKAFGKTSDKRQFCYLGSAKSNIGHCESAAGVAGITKILLQLKHKKIVPSLHSEVLNPNIEFTQTPFIVNQTLRDWEKPVIKEDGEEKEYPRIAGISSFGAGGSNAHMIIEEYEPEDLEKQPPVIINEHNPVLILLSAKTKAQIGQLSKALLETIDNNNYRNDDLVKIAYTLQVGREAMEERLALIVNSMDDLRIKLADYLAGKDDIEDLYEGNSKKEMQSLEVFKSNKDLQEVLHKWIKEKKLSLVIDLWIKGLEVDWTLLYPEKTPGRISVTFYPFLKESYWIDIPKETEIPNDTDINIKAEVTEQKTDKGYKQIHPLLHENTSTIEEVRFSSMFTGDDRLLKDYELFGQRVLPEALYLEMAIAALHKAAGYQNHTIQLENIGWTAPVSIHDDSKELHIVLVPGDNKEIDYEIFGKNSLTDEEAIFNQGRGKTLSNQGKERFDIPSEKNECNKKTLRHDELYDLFDKNGLHYGESNKTIKTLFMGHDVAIAELTLPTAAQDQKDAYHLHPSMVNGAVQAAIGFLWEDGLQTPYRPFFIQKLTVFTKSSDAMWALVTQSSDTPTKNKPQTVDIYLCDQAGTLCAEIEGLALKYPGQKPDLPEPDIPAEVLVDAPKEIVLFEPGQPESTSPDEAHSHEELNGDSRTNFSLSNKWISVENSFSTKEKPKLSLQTMFINNEKK